MSKFTNERLYQVFCKGTVVRGKDSSIYRKDKFGTIIYWYSYGKLTTMGWEVDHSKPKSKGGSEHLNNLQPLHWLANRQKSNSYR